MQTRGPIHAQDTDELMRGMETQQRWTASVMEENPGLPYVTAWVIAGDQISAERRLTMVQEGKCPADTAVWLTGSYARFGQALRFVDMGLLTRDWLLDNLPELWRSSDPDDTNIEYLRLWHEAFVRNGRTPVRDGRPLPKGKVVQVFRGQIEGQPLGFAWTTDPKIAQKFAATGGGRTAVEGGVVYRGTVARSSVLAYLTGRGESEVIVAPSHVSRRRL